MKTNEGLEIPSNDKIIIPILLNFKNHMRLFNLIKLITTKLIDKSIKFHRLFQRTPVMIISAVSRLKSNVHSFHLIYKHHFYSILF